MRYNRSPVASFALDVEDRQFQQAIAGTDQNKPYSVVKEDRSPLYLTTPLPAQEVPAWVLQFAHDLSTSLSTVILSLDLLQDGLSVSESQEVWHSVSHAIARQQKLLRSLLTIARVEHGSQHLNLEPVEVVQIVRDVASEYRKIASMRHLRLQLTIDDEPHFVAGTEPFIDTVVANLLDNAIKYSPSGGSVACHVKSARHGCLIHVSDTGPGIHEQELDSLFSPFYRSRANADHQSKPGSGIGLFLVDKLVRCMHGTVDVESALDEGTTFSVWLPGWTDDSPQDST